MTHSFGAGCLMCVRVVCLCVSLCACFVLAHSCAQACVLSTCSVYREHVFLSSTASRSFFTLSSICINQHAGAERFMVLMFFL